MAEIATLTTRHGTLYRHDDTTLIMEDDGTGWLTIGPLDGNSIVVCKEEWPAFVEMINAIDAARKAGGEDGPVPL
jgi:hypothetical protein